MRRERVEAQHHRGETGDAGGRFELPGHRRGDGQLPVKQPVNVRAVMPRTAGYFLDGKAGIPDQLRDVNAHASNSVASLQKVKGLRGAKVVIAPHHFGMPRWKYRDAFDADYKAFKKSSRLDEKAIAEKLGKSPHMVASYRRKGDSGSIPPEDVIRKAAVLFGHKDPFRYMDDPRVAEGVGMAVYAEMPQWMKDLLQRQARTMDGSTLSPNQWEMLLDALAAQARAIESASQAGKKDVTK